MSNPETVFILGAGASAPYGLPTGKLLRKAIYETYPKRLQQILGDSYGTDTRVHQATNFAESFRKSRRTMIDLYLNRNPDYLDIGREAIVLSLMHAEMGCHFGEDAKEPSEAWYSVLLSELTTGIVKPDDLDFSAINTGFITFNYDRTLEAFLFESLSNSFKSVKRDDIIKQINSIPIIHVFGQYAPLPWQSEDMPLEFRVDPVDARKDYLRFYPANIEIFYDNRTHPRIEQAREMIRYAQRIFMLGFGYAEENLELLGLPDTISKVEQIYATSLGILPTRSKSIREKYFPHFNRAGRQLKFEPVGCLEMIKEYF